MDPSVSLRRGRGRAKARSIAFALTFLVLFVSRQKEQKDIFYLNKILIYTLKKTGKNILLPGRTKINNWF
jgi:hypothetical protein